MSYKNQKKNRFFSSIKRIKKFQWVRKQYGYRFYYNAVILVYRGSVR